MAAEDDQSREQALRKMLLALDRSDRLIRQLLTQARIDNQQTRRSPPSPGAAVAVHPGHPGPIALKRTNSSPWRANGRAGDGTGHVLELMFGNLIDNALRYPGGRRDRRGGQSGGQPGPGGCAGQRPRYPHRRPVTAVRALLPGQSPAGDGWGSAWP